LRTCTCQSSGRVMVNVFIICGDVCKMSCLKANVILYMKINKMFFKLAPVFVVTVLFGCTKQFWYESVKLQAENECRNQPPSAMESCRERLNKRSYEDYEKERTGSKQ
jgi:hypothetical protein